MMCWEPLEPPGDGVSQVRATGRPVPDWSCTGQTQKSLEAWLQAQDVLSTKSHCGLVCLSLKQACYPDHKKLE